MPTLDWIGKKAVLNHHRETPYHLLKCDPKLSVGDPGSGNLLVQGDNLIALKALLPYYAGKVKCIYIDPPYNTGNEGWVYNDAVNSPEIRAWLGRVVGKEAEDLSRHDKWLCMMYPRLSMLREMLREDGLIFVSVDENEHRHLELLLDELFGASNHVETIIWKKSYGGGAKSKHIVNLHEYIACYAKSIDKVPLLEGLPDEKTLKYYRLKDSKYIERGPYRLQPLATNSMDPRPNLRYPIPYQGDEIWPEKQWQWSRERVLAALANDELVVKKKAGAYTISYKQYLKDTEGRERSSKMYSIIEGIYTQQGTNEIAEMFGDGKAFSFPKPRRLVEHILGFATDKQSLILDSFAGSGTTGHAVLSLNKKDGGQRRFICVEMDENISEKITAQRISRAIVGYVPNTGEKTEPVSALGGGYRFCMLGHSLFDDSGRVFSGVSFVDLAQHVFFTETGEPLTMPPNGKRSPMIGIHRETAYYLLFNGVLGDKRPGGGNVLTSAVLRELPKHDGPKVVFGEGCRLGQDRLKRERITFKQIPYEIKVS